MVPLAVASDRSESLAYSSQRLVNLYAETSQFGGKSPFILLGTPGLKPYKTVGDGPHRGSIKMAGEAYVVSGDTLYHMPVDGGPFALGVIDGSGYVSMATVGTQIAIATSENNGFIYDSSDSSFAKITDTDFYGGTSVTSLDGYFIWSSDPQYTNRWQLSALLDGKSYDALDFASAESTATKLVRVFLVGSQVFMMKTDRIEVWYDSGNADFPFDRLNSTIIPKGLAAKFSPAYLDNSLFFLGLDDDGGGSPIVYRINGYSPQVISTPAVALALSTVTDLDQIMGVTYVRDNHSFYGMILPNGNAWFYDASNGAWHERGTYRKGRWLPNTMIDAYGKTLAGSNEDGAVYELDAETYIDAGTIPLIAEATLPDFGTDGSFKRCSRLRLDMETGVGLITGQGSQPIVTLNVSDDRGRNWSSDIEAPIQAIGDFGATVEWTQMGQFRSRIHKIWISDPVKRALIALYADLQ